jgi:hypothetical protein
MTDISEAERLALITHTQVDLVLEEAESAELEARAFSQDRARQRRAQSITIDWSADVAGESHQGRAAGRRVPPMLAVVNVPCHNRQGSGTVAAWGGQHETISRMGKSSSAS